MLLAGGAHSLSSNQKNSPTDVVLSVPMLVPQPSSASLAHPTTQSVTTSAALPPPALLPGIIASALRQPTARNVHIGKLSSDILRLKFKETWVYQMYASSLCQLVDALLLTGSKNTVN
jgi:hypothetical protein